LEFNRRLSSDFDLHDRCTDFFGNLAHKKRDASVLAAYGWPMDLGDVAILKRLLALNLARTS
jgi:hypothetical protein